MPKLFVVLTPGMPDFSWWKITKMWKTMSTWPEKNAKCRTSYRNRNTNSRWPWNTPILSSQGLPKCTQIGIFGLKIYHQATRFDTRTEVSFIHKKDPNSWPKYSAKNGIFGFLQRVPSWTLLKLFTHRYLMRDSISWPIAPVFPVEGEDGPNGPRRQGNPSVGDVRKFAKGTYRSIHM
jgi:hypothetical protein